MTFETLGRIGLNSKGAMTLSVFLTFGFLIRARFLFSENVVPGRFLTLSNCKSMSLDL